MRTASAAPADRSCLRSRARARGPGGSAPRPHRGRTRPLSAARRSPGAPPALARSSDLQVGDLLAAALQLDHVAALVGGRKAERDTPVLGDLLFVVEAVNVNLVRHV